MFSSLPGLVRISRKSKFYWVKMTEGEPGWKKLEKSVDFDTFVIVCRAYENICELDLGVPVLLTVKAHPID